MCIFLVIYSQHTSTVDAVTRGRFHDFLRMALNIKYLNDKSTCARTNLCNYICDITDLYSFSNNNNNNI